MKADCEAPAEGSRQSRLAGSARGRERLIPLPHEHRSTVEKIEGIQAQGGIPGAERELLGQAQVDRQELLLPNTIEFRHRHIPHDPVRAYDTLKQRSWGAFLPRDPA